MLGVLFQPSASDMHCVCMLLLTVSAVLVDLFVGADLDRRSKLDGRQAALQLSAHHQVVMFIDSLKLLFDAQTFVSRLEDHLGLPEKPSTCKDVGKNMCIETCDVSKNAKTSKNAQEGQGVRYSKQSISLPRTGQQF